MPHIPNNLHLKKKTTTLASCKLYVFDSVVFIFTVPRREVGNPRLWNRMQLTHLSGAAPVWLLKMIDVYLMKMFFISVLSFLKCNSKLRMIL